MSHSIHRTEPSCCEQSCGATTGDTLGLQSEVQVPKGSIESRSDGRWRAGLPPVAAPQLQRLPAELPRTEVRGYRMSSLRDCEYQSKTVGNAHPTDRGTRPEAETTIAGGVSHRSAISQYQQARRATQATRRGSTCAALRASFFGQRFRWLTPPAGIVSASGLIAPDAVPICS